MKRKIFTCFLLLSFAVNSFAATGYNVAPKATDIVFSIGTSKISLQELSVIKVKDFEKLSGKHLNFFERVAFRSSQKKLRNNIAEDGTVKNKTLVKAMSGGDHSTGFHLGGFALGFLLGLIGVLITYLIKGDEDVDRNRRKWAWIGCGVLVVLDIILVLTVLHRAVTPY